MIDDTAARAAASPAAPAAQFVASLHLPMPDGAATLDDALPELSLQCLRCGRGWFLDLPASLGTSVRQLMAGHHSCLDHVHLERPHSVEPALLDVLIRAAARFSRFAAAVGCPEQDLQNALALLAARGHRVPGQEERSTQA